MSDRELMAKSDDEQSTKSTSSTSDSQSGDERLEKDTETGEVEDPEEAPSTVSDEGRDSPVIKPPMLALLEPTEGQYDIVLVHGLHGDQQKCWAGPTDEDGKPTWLTEGLAGNPPVARIYSFGYSLKLDSLSKSPMTAIHDLADLLVNELYEKIKDDPTSPFRPIMFITHDIGGVIVKEALRITFLEKTNYNWLSIYTRALVFFGCPHQSIYDGSMTDQLLPLVFQHGPPSGKLCLQDIVALGKGIEELNASFVGLQASLSMEIINIYSNNSAPKIFDQVSATIGLPYEINLASSKSHSELCRLQKEDAIYRKIEDRISGSAKGMSSTSGVDYFHTQAPQSLSVERSG
ncbi:hypothetical protein BO99DRAFT_36549 [Aspergillus violaceofuscus CBS 115571]|uniref:DUF676 domain-containing protein n=1 Tax=Aspergillus violaceofuscus (strain CBS 115571) TaxID=1450538 RepID=A0A2V5GSH7_ASPV1|nr:hypothetical protein BO99DRAFT_36549 [Aspergillus violaceofuscus CBS 115571]